MSDAKSQKTKKPINQNLTVPNAMSVFRILVIPFFAYFFLKGNLTAAIVALGLSGLSDALDGKIDLIVTKSVSRFARNTVDTLTTIRKLKEKGVGVIFEKENIDTLDSKGELLITIMSSLAQEESRSISENVTWGQRKRFSDGKVTMPFKHFLGYARNSDGTPRLVESEARIVRQIYAMCMDGQTPSGIADETGRSIAKRFDAMVAFHGKIHLDERKVQGRRAAAKKLHNRLSQQKDETKRRRGAQLLR